MNTVTLKLNLPENIHQKLEQQPPQIREMAIQLAIEALTNYLEQAEKLAVGREILRQLPQKAEEHPDTPPVDLAEHHDRYLYGKS